MMFCFCGWQIQAQTISGYVWEDSNANGIIDTGEHALANILIRMMGRDRCQLCDWFCGCDCSCTSAPSYEYPSQMTDTTGFYQFYVNESQWSGGRGNYVLMVSSPGDEYRPSIPLFIPPDVELDKNTYLPFGLYQRFSFLDNLFMNLLNGGTFHYLSLGDSIAVGFNTFCLWVDNNYVEDIGDRLLFLHGNVVTDNRAVSGERTEDLLLDDPGADENDIYYAVQTQPQLITLSIIGNNFLDNQPGGVDPTSRSVRMKSCYEPGPCGNDTRSWEEVISDSLEVLLMARQDLQEILSTLISKTNADIILNTLYENEAGDDNTFCLGSLCQVTDLHKELLPVVNKVLREVAWGQERVVRVAEVHPDYHHQPTVSYEDAQGGHYDVPCVGFPDIICCGDNIHPDSEGARVHEQRIMESMGMVAFGTNDTGNGDSGEYGDDAGRTLHNSVNFGFIRRVARLCPSRYEVKNGATVKFGRLALVPDQFPAKIYLNNWDPSSPGQFIVRGYKLPDGILPAKVLVKVRYRTSAPPDDEYYRIEASFVDFKRPPLLNVENFNYITPIVGTHGMIGPGYNTSDWGPEYDENQGGTPPSVPVLAYPHYPQFRTVSASLYKGGIRVADQQDPRYVTYEWPVPDARDIGKLEVRVIAARKQAHPLDPSITPGEAYAVEVDGIWLEVYGTMTPAFIAKQKREHPNSPGTPLDTCYYVP